MDSGRRAAGESMKVEDFVHEQNLARYRQLLAKGEHMPDRQYQQILILLAEEEAKDEEPAK